MKHLIRSFVRDEKGNVILMVGVLLAILLVFSVWAIDTSQMTLVRTQLQNAADAGALSAALALGQTGDSSAAITAAQTATSANVAVIQQGDGNVMGDVDISAADVTFPEDGVVRVTTHRTEATNDNFMNYFMRIFDPSNGQVGEMTAKAAAGFYWVCGGTCLKPWAPPDRWADVDSNGVFDTTGGDYYDPVTTGYDNSDLGAEVRLILGQKNQGDFGQYWWYAVDFPPDNKGTPIPGDAQYRAWVTGCADPSVSIEPGDDLQVEPGNVCCGQNANAVQSLLDLDPLATFNSTTGEVENSAYPVSPRIIKAPFFDPSIGLSDAGHGRKLLRVTKIGVLFIESYSTIGGNKGQLIGRFMRLAEPDGTVCEDQSEPTFLYKTALIE